MVKYAKDNPKQLWRWINDEIWCGYHFSETKRENKELAIFLRRQGIPVRAITLPASRGMNYGMQAPERYVIYVPKNLQSYHRIANRILEFYQQKKKDNQ